MLFSIICKFYNSQSFTTQTTTHYLKRVASITTVNFNELIQNFFRSRFASFTRLVSTWGVEYFICEKMQAPKTHFLKKSGETSDAT